MAKLAGGFLKLLQTFLYVLTFCCAGIVLGIYSYFLAVQADRSATIPTWQKAVEGISGAAVVYLIFAVILTCCLGGKPFFAFLAIALDIAFCGGFIAIAVLLRQATGSCTGDVTTPLGSGPSDSKQGYGGTGGNNVTYASSLGFACRLNKAAFAVAIIAAGLFLISAVVQLVLGKHHQREKRYGPSPRNNYTAGSPKRKFWQRKPKTHTMNDTYVKDSELGATGGLAAPHHDAYRPSHETGYTGTTVNSPAHNTFTGNKYESTPVAPVTNGHGYHTAPTGSAVNPYGYDNTRTAPTNF